MGNKRFDWIQFGILLLTLLGILGAIVAWMLSYFPSAKAFDSLDARVQKVELLPTDVAVIKEEVHEIKRTLDKHWK